tara:strand:+ start:4077 stop:4481 length:405 start_codon:yes stop_codon:yes gene_type:complete
MYNYYFCSQINDDFYDHKLDINKLSYLINKYDLKCKGSVKEYWINNIIIISNDDLIFKRIIDKDIHFTDNYLIQKYDMYDCDKFNFSETHLEEEYILYENIIDDIKINVKKYDNFITLMYQSQNNIENNFLYYI